MNVSLAVFNNIVYTWFSYACFVLCVCLFMCVCMFVCGGGCIMHPPVCLISLDNGMHNML